MSLLLACLLALPAQESDPGTLSVATQLWPTAPRTSPCISPEERLRVRLDHERHRRTSGPDIIAASTNLQPIPFFPMGVRPNRDSGLNFHFDVSFVLGGSVRDFECGPYTYPNHQGSDFGIRGFEEQLVGVPVFAAMDGVIVSTHDGETDMNTVVNCPGGGPPANFVTIDHGMGVNGLYWHLRNGSVSVVPGQCVVAGQQIGEVGASGCANGPHLHLEFQDLSVPGGPIEPFAGSCRAGGSLWESQPIPVRTPVLSDLTLTRDTSPAAFEPLVRQGTYALGTQILTARFTIRSFPGGTWTVRYQRPDLTFANATVSNTTPGGLTPVSIWLAASNLNLNQTGTWRVHLDLNGTNLAVAPFEVVPDASMIVNRAPHPITVSITPLPFADTTDILRCEVETDLVLDDPDYDVVRYRYVWDVDGVVVRDVVSAGQADVLPRNTALLGQTVTCTVTPSDGQLAAPSASAWVTLDRAPFPRRVVNSVLGAVSRSL